MVRESRNKSDVASEAGIEPGSSCMRGGDSTTELAVLEEPARVEGAVVAEVALVPLLRLPLAQPDAVEGPADSQGLRSCIFKKIKLLILLHLPKRN